MVRNTDNTRIVYSFNLLLVFLFPPKNWGVQKEVQVFVYTRSKASREEKGETRQTDIYENPCISVRVRKWSQDSKRSPNCEMIPILVHIGPQMIPTKNKESHGLISEESENICKNYELKKMRFIILQNNIPQLLYFSSKGIDRFHCHAKKKHRKPSGGKS